MKQSLSLAQLLLATLIAALAIAQWQHCRSGERPFEDVLLLGCLAGWLVGLLLGRALFGRGVLGAAIVSAIAAGRVSANFGLSWRPLAIVATVAGALAAASAGMTLYGPSILASAWSNLRPKSAITTLTRCLGLLCLALASVALIAFVSRSRPPRPQRFSGLVDQRKARHGKREKPLACSVDGRYLAKCEHFNSALPVLDTTTGEVRRIKFGTPYAWLTDMSPSGRQFFVGDERGTALLHMNGGVRWLNPSLETFSQQFLSETTIGSPHENTAWDISGVSPMRVTNKLADNDRDEVDSSIPPAVLPAIGGQHDVGNSPWWDYIVVTDGDRVCGQILGSVNDGKTFICCEHRFRGATNGPAWLAELPFVGDSTEDSIEVVVVVVDIERPQRVLRTSPISMEYVTGRFEELVVTPFLTKDSKCVIVADGARNIALWRVEDLLRRR